MKFIKLTNRCNDMPVIINTDKIITVTCSKGIGSGKLIVTIHFNSKHEEYSVEVREPMEVVMALLSANK